MTRTVAVYDKQTGRLVDEGTLEVRQRPTNYQAMIQWRSITAIKSGDTTDEAAQNVLHEVSNGPVISQYEVRLL